MDRACKKPGFGSPQGGVKYKPMAPVIPSPKVGNRPSNSNILGKGKKVSLNGIRKDKSNNRSSHISSAYEEEYNSNTQQEEEGSDDDKDDFACVPVNNIDNETVHIKVLEDDPRSIHRSQVGHPLESGEFDNIYH